MAPENLLGEPPETLLPADPAAAADADPEAAARANPASSLAWARLAEQALADGCDVEAYAFARTGYHRALAALATASERIGDTEEADRCRQFLRDSSDEGYRELVGDA